MTRPDQTSQVPQPTCFWKQSKVSWGTWLGPHHLWFQNLSTFSLRLVISLRWRLVSGYLPTIYCNQPEISKTVLCENPFQKTILMCLCFVSNHYPDLDRLVGEVFRKLKLTKVQYFIHQTAFWPKTFHSNIKNAPGPVLITKTTPLFVFVSLYALISNLSFGFGKPFPLLICRRWWSVFGYLRTIYFNQSENQPLL